MTRWKKSVRRKETDGRRPPNCCPPPNPEQERTKSLSSIIFSPYVRPFVGLQRPAVWAASDFKSSYVRIFPIKWYRSCCVSDKIVRMQCKLVQEFLRILNNTKVHNFFHSRTDAEQMERVEFFAYSPTVWSGRLTYISSKCGGLPLKNIKHIRTKFVQYRTPDLWTEIFCPR